MIRGKNFLKQKESEWEEVEKGITRKVTGYNTQMMMVQVKFERGATGYVHDHFHTQASYVASGRFKITIDDESEILEAGDSFFVPPNLKHGAECLEAGILIDVFRPVREDFL